MRALYLLSATVFAGWTQFPPTVLRFLHLPAAPSTSPTPRQGHKFCPFQAVLTAFMRAAFFHFRQFLLRSRRNFFRTFCVFCICIRLSCRASAGSDLSAAFQYGAFKQGVLACFSKTRKTPALSQKEFCKGASLIFQKKKRHPIFRQKKRHPKTDVFLFGCGNYLSSRRVILKYFRRKRA